MKKLLLSLFAVGLVLGIGQMFYVREITYRPPGQKIRTSERDGDASCLAMSPECGVCLYEERGGYCYAPSHRKKVRGFPLWVGAYGKDAKTDISAAVIANIGLLATGLPLIGYVGAKATKAAKHKTKTKR
jgi:hypothetical protein